MKLLQIVPVLLFASVPLLAKDESKKSNGTSAVTELKTKADANKALKESGELMAVKFFAEWCPACQSAKAGYKGAAGKHPEFRTHEVNVENKDLLGWTKFFNVSALPTVVFLKKPAKKEPALKDLTIVATKVGAMDEAGYDKEFAAAHEASKKPAPVKAAKAATGKKAEAGAKGVEVKKETTDAKEKKETKPASKTADLKVLKTKADAESVMKEPAELMVIKFTAPWCGACKFAKPGFLEAAQKHPEFIAYEVDVDNAALLELTRLFNVTALPTVVFFHKPTKKDATHKDITQLHKAVGGKDASGYHKDFAAAHAKHKSIKEKLEAKAPATKSEATKPAKGADASSKTDAKPAKKPAVTVRGKMAGLAKGVTV